MAMITMMIIMTMIALAAREMDIVLVIIDPDEFDVFNDDVDDDDDGNDNLLYRSNATVRK